MFIRRFIQLQIGLLLYGASLALMVRANLGLNRESPDIQLYAGYVRRF